MGGDFPPRFLTGFRRNPFRARRGGPVGWVSGFGFSGLNFRGSNPGGVPFFQKPRVGGRGCTSASGGRPPFILGFRVFHFWFRSSLVPHPPCWLSRLGVGFGCAKVVGSIPGRDLFFQNARRELETCRFSFPGTCPCTFLKEIHSLARVRSQFHSLARVRVFSLRNVRGEIHSLARVRFFGRPRTPTKMVAMK